MDPFDIDGREAVADLNALQWDRYGPDGVLVERHVGADIVEQRGPWATVILSVQDKKRGRWLATRYVFARYRKEAGAWRLQNYFRASPTVFAELPAKISEALTLTPERETRVCGSSS